MEEKSIKTYTVLVTESQKGTIDLIWIKTFLTYNAAENYAKFCLQSEEFSTDIKHAMILPDTLNYYTNILGPVQNGNTTFYYITGKDNDRMLDITIQEELALSTFKEE